MLLESANRMDFKNALEIVFLKGVKYCLYAMGCTGVVQIIAYLLIIIGHKKQGRTDSVLPLNFCFFLNGCLVNCSFLTNHLTTHFTFENGKRLKKRVWPFGRIDQLLTTRFLPEPLQRLTLFRFRRFFLPDILSRGTVRTRILTLSKILRTKRSGVRIPCSAPKIGVWTLVRAPVFSL